ncbi:MAG: hypothetical protein U5O39_02675 [Gammaproteobacteria bacterium]|nr:hypothetical protein [Gammaproteobacteria bacterium]
MTEENIKHVVSCRECALNALCIPHGMSLDEVDRINQLVERGRPLPSKRHSFTSRAIKFDVRLCGARRRHQSLLP